MANFNSKNYQAQYVNKPSEKIRQGEVSGIKRILFDSFIIPAAGFSAGDKILSLTLPEGALVTDARVLLPNLGATGIFDLGHLGNSVEAADQNGFVDQADAGGQPVFEPADVDSANIYTRFSKDTQVALTCDEIVPVGAAGSLIQWEVEYIIN
jgi:hypothetical protein